MSVNNQSKKTIKHNVYRSKNDYQTKIKPMETDKQDLLNRLRYYKEKRHTRDDRILMNELILFLKRFETFKNSKLKYEALSLLDKVKTRENELRTIKKQDYVGKN